MIKSVVIFPLFYWAYDESYISSNPAKSIKPIKYIITPRTSLTLEELNIVRMSCISTREIALVEFLYSTGCRVSELVNLSIEDIDWNNKRVLLFGKGNKYRYSYINNTCYKSLTSYLSARIDDNPNLFVSIRYPYKGLSKEGIENIIRVISNRIYPIIGKHITPHIFRHTTASLAIKNGMRVEDVKSLLGHTNINTTMIYVHNNLDDLKEKHERYIV